MYSTQIGRDMMNEHEQVLNMIRTKNEAPINLDPAHTALVIVDMQRYFTESGFPFTEVFNHLSPGVATGYLKRVREMVVPNIQRLLACFRTNRSPVIYTAVGTETGDGEDLPGWLKAVDTLGMATLGSHVWPPISDPSWEIDSALSPEAGELVLNKLSAGTFATTGLEQRFRNQGIDSVIVTGVASDVCVSTTAREAADRGFQSIMVSDACTTLSTTMHQASLDTFNIVLGSVRTTAGVVRLLNKVSQVA